MSDLDRINAAIDRMRTFTPSDPYILTIPQDVDSKYRHSYAYQQRQWTEHTPFDLTEHESLQYQTFHIHDPAKEMYMPHSSQYSSVSKHEQQRQKIGEGTPSTAPKKKITLDAYKKKLNGGTPEVREGRGDEQIVRKPAAKGPVKGPVERPKVDEEILASLEGEGDCEAPAETAKAERKELKRKREDDHEAEGKEEAHKKHKQEVIPKKQAEAEDISDRVPTVGEATDVKSMSQAEASTPVAKGVQHRQELPTQNTIEDDDARLPPKLSPPHVSTEETSLPPKLSPPSTPSLPPKLSPTIPANIAQTLKARKHFRNASRSSDISANGRNLTPPREVKNGLLKKSPRNGFRATSSSPAIRSDVEERGRPLSSVSAHLDRLDSGADLADEINVAKPVKQLSTSKGPLKLIVKLKFKKATRETVRRILKMKPRPQQSGASKESTDGFKMQSSVSDARHREQREAGTKGLAQKVGPVRKTNGEVKKSTEAKVIEKELKRSRTEDSDSDDRPAKRNKPLIESPEIKRERPPSTPDKQGTASPTAMQRATATPGNMRKDLLSVSMKREQSNDSVTNTPSAMSQSSPPETTTPATQSNGTAKASSSQRSATKTPKQVAWESEQKRLEILGRELKHAAPAHLTPAATSTDPKPRPSVNDQKLAAIKSLESLLAYVLAFSSADEANKAASPRIPPSSHLWRSLQGLYNFVKRHCEAFPLLHGIACSLGVVFNARVMEIVVDHRGEAAAAKDMLLVEATAMMFKAAREAEAKLDVGKMMQAFPKTWDGRVKKGYEVPFGVTTAPREAARAGLAMLREWVEGEGLGYEMRVEVGKGGDK